MSTAHRDRRRRQSRFGPYQRATRAIALTTFVVVVAVPGASALGGSTPTTDPPSTTPVDGGPTTVPPVTTDSATTDVVATSEPATTEAAATTEPTAEPQTSIPAIDSTAPEDTTPDGGVETSDPDPTIVDGAECVLPEGDATTSSLPEDTVTQSVPVSTIDTTFVDEVCEPTDAAPSIVLLTPTISVFPDGDGNLTNDEDEVAFFGEPSGLSGSVRLTNSSPTALATMTIVAPSESMPSEWAKVDIESVRAVVPTGTTAQLLVTYGDGTTLVEDLSGDASISVGTRKTSVSSVQLTVRGVVDDAPTIAPGVVVGLDLHGVLNEGVGTEDLPDGASPGVELCASVSGAARPNDAPTSSGAECGVVAVQDSAGGIVLLAAVQGTWTVTGANPSWAGDAVIPATAFPSATFQTNSNTPTIPSGASAFLGASTPFGAAFESTQNSPYLSLRAAAGGVPSVTTFTFASPTPIGWGFATGDVDADVVTVSASGPSGPLTGSQLGFQGAFNYCTSAPVPSSCDSPPFTDLPVWDPVTSTLRGNILDSDGATGWFRPTVSVTSLTLTFGVQSGIPIYQLWFAAPTSDSSGAVSETTPSGPAPAPAGTALALLTSAGDPVFDRAGDPVTTATAADGTYAFLGVASGPYVVEVLPPSGYEVVGPSTLSADSTSSDVTGVDFVIQLIPPGTPTTTALSPATTTLPPTTTTAPSAATTTDPSPSSTTTVGAGGGGVTTTAPSGVLPQTGGAQNGIVTVAAALVLAGLVIFARLRSGRRAS